MNKYNLLVPLAGKGQRFRDAGIKTPKPMIQIDGKSIIEWSLGCVKMDECNLIFVVRADHVSDYDIDGFLKQKFGPCTVVVANHDTKGSVDSCLLAKEYINNDLPLIVHTSDVYFEVGQDICGKKLGGKYYGTFDPATADGMDGMILTFKSNSPNYSYSKIDYRGYVEEVAEKTVISNNASTGVYCFSTGKMFVSYAEEYIPDERDLSYNSTHEYYIAPLYNLMIEDGQRIATLPVDKMHIFGTPNELEFFVNNSLKTFPRKVKTIGVCSDHSGFARKEYFKVMLNQMNFNVIDYGTFSEKDCDYIEFVNMACDGYLNGDVDFLFGFCRSGQGVNIAANKRNGIRAAVVYDEYAAEYAIRHNCANFFSIPTKEGVLSEDKEIVDLLLQHTFDGGRHQARIIKMED